MQAGPITVDVCKAGCGGVWFDRFELKKVDERHEAAGEPILRVERNPATSVDLNKRRLCPSCGQIPMMRHFASVKRRITLDECPKCGGTWLDAGELTAIRDEFTSEEERTRAAEEYFTALFGDDLKRMRAEDEAGLERSRRIANMFRFICPSYYLPGKQSWGAF
jgi:hypothetical protein